jgi:hypothetical protein
MPDRRLRTGSVAVRNSKVPTEASVRRGVKTKYDRGEITNVWNFFGLRVRDRTWPAQPEPRITTLSRSPFEASISVSVDAYLRERICGNAGVRLEGIWEVREAAPRRLFDVCMDLDGRKNMMDTLGCRNSVE